MGWKRSFEWNGNEFLFFDGTQFLALHLYNGSHLIGSYGNDSLGYILKNGYKVPAWNGKEIPIWDRAIVKSKYALVHQGLQGVMSIVLCSIDDFPGPVVGPTGKHFFNSTWDGKFNIYILPGRHKLSASASIYQPPSDVWFTAKAGKTYSIRPETENKVTKPVVVELD